MSRAIIKALRWEQAPNGWCNVLPYQDNGPRWQASHENIKAMDSIPLYGIPLSFLSEKTPSL